MQKSGGLYKKALIATISLFIFLLLCVIFSNVVVAASLTTEFENLYTGPDGKNITAYKVVESNDGGYIILCNIESDGWSNADIYVIKTDSNGRQLWNITIGGSDFEYSFDFFPTDNGGGILSGRTDSYDIDNGDIYLVSFDGNGSILKTKTIGTPNWENAYHILPSHDNIILCGGRSDSGSPSAPDPKVGYDIFLMCVDYDFNVIWEKQYDESPREQISSIIETSDGGYLLADIITKYPEAEPGTREYDVLSNGLLIKTDALGNVQWVKKIDVSDTCTLDCVLETNDGKFLLMGRYSNLSQVSGRYLACVSQTGDIIWESLWPGSPSITDIICYNGDHTYAIYNCKHKYNGQYSDQYSHHIGGRELNVTTIDDNGHIIDSLSAGNFSDNLTISYINRMSNGDYILTGFLEDVTLKRKVYFSKVIISPDTIPIEKVIPPVAAVVTGASVSILGIAWGKVFEFLQGGLKSYAQRYYSFLEVRYRHIVALPKKPIFAGISLKELGVGALAAILLGVAFFIVKKSSLDIGLILLFILIAGVTTVVHELAHLYFAYRYKTDTELKFWCIGTVTMFFTTIFFGTVFAQPARTIINKMDQLGKKKAGIVSLAGPVASLVLSIIFASMMLFGGGLADMGMKGLPISLLSCVYSLMPFSPMEGRNVFVWNKLVWGAIFIPMLIIFLGISIFVL